MKMFFESKSYTDKFFIFPMVEVAWQRANKILSFKLAFLKWSVKTGLNF